VGSVRIRGWQNELPKPGLAWQTEVKVDDFEKGDLLLEKFLAANDQGHLVTHYAPGEHFVQSFRWVLGVLPPKEYVFRVDVQDRLGRPLAHSRALRENLCVQQGK